jgi:hypothetical protein
MMHMRYRYTTLLPLFISTFVFASCTINEGVGPEGPPGPQGPPGPEILPATFEFNATLLPSNGFEFYQDIPQSIEVLESDVVLAFVLEEYIPEDDLEVWRQLPITDFNERGSVIFDFDFTLVDLRVFLYANYPLSFSDGYEDVLIRAVHIPANFAAKMKPGALKKVDHPDDLEALLGVEFRKIVSD